MRLSDHLGQLRFYAEHWAGERGLQLRRAHKMPTAPVPVW